MYKIINKKKLYATIAADVVGNIVFGPERLLRPRNELRPEEIRKILVIRSAYIGDVVMTLPVLKPLKDRFPGAKLSFLTSSSATPLLEQNPFLDEIIAYDPFWFYPTGRTQYRNFMREFRKRDFDLVIEARADIREFLFLVRPLNARYKVSYDIGGGGYLLTHVVPYPGLKHKVEYHLDLARYLGCKTGEAEWGIYLSEEEKEESKRMLALHGVSGPFITSHPGSRMPLKRWLQDRYGILYDRIMGETGMPLVLFGAPGEIPLINEIVKKMRKKPLVFAGKATLRQMAGTIAQSSLFICNDSAPMHISAAMKTPTIAIFGPSKSIETGPFGSGHKVVEKDFSCRYACDEGTCRNDRFNACMEDISVDDVFEAVTDSRKESKK